MFFAQNIKALQCGKIEQIIMASCTVHLICSQKPVLWPVQAAHELTLQSDV